MKWAPLWVFPTLVVLSVATVWLRLSIVRTSYSISQSDKMIKNLQHEREQSEVKLSAQKSPRRLEHLARSRFQLAQPRADQVIYMRSSPVDSSGATENSK
jgi:hypothetical protein